MSPARPRSGVLAAVTVGLIAAGSVVDPALAEVPATPAATTSAAGATDTAPTPATVSTAPAAPPAAATTTAPPATTTGTTTTDPAVAADDSVGGDSGGSGRKAESDRRRKADRDERSGARREARERRKAKAHEDRKARTAAARKAREERAREAAEEEPADDTTGVGAAAFPSTGSPFGAALPAIPGLFIDKFRIPPFLLPIYQAAGVQYGVPWEILAAINEIETDYGRNLNVSSAGAQGWMQFMPATWKAYGVDADGDRRADPMNPVDAIFAAARYLRAAGIEQDVRKAVFAYNHADWYVDSVLLRARLIGGLPSALVSSLTGLTEAQLPVAGARAEEADPKVARDGADAASGEDAGSGTDGDGADATATSPSDSVWGPRRGDDRAAQIAAQAGTPVVAVQDATVVGMGTSATMGRWIRIRDVYGNRYTYAHLGTLAETYEVPRSTAATVRHRAPAADPAPKAPASAGRQKAVAHAAAPAASTPPAPVKNPSPAPAAGGPRARPTTSGPRPAATVAPFGIAATPGTLAPSGIAAPPSTVAPSGIAAPAVLWDSARRPAVPFAPSLLAPLPPVVPPTLEALIGPPMPGTPASPPATRVATPRRAPSGRTVDRALRVGSQVPGGTVLGTIGRSAKRTATGRTVPSTTKRATMAFGVRPAGRGAPRVDPRPFLDGWRLLAASSGTAAEDRRRALFRAGTAADTPGQVLLLSKARLQASVLDDDRLEIPAVGREQIRAGQIDRRVLATLAYLSASGHRIRVSSLRRAGAITVSGNVSEHDSGNAVDIAEVDGQTITPATQGPGTVTDRTIRLLLRLQGTTTPHQIISLMVPSDFGGASNVLAMADHADHIHVGFRVTIGDGSVLGRQLASALKPAQWDDLVERLDAIGNPEVAPTASKYAVKVRRSSTGR